MISSFLTGFYLFSHPLFSFPYFHILFIRRSIHSSLADRLSADLHFRQHSRENRSIKVFVDNHCLNDGETWMDGFLNGVEHSQIILLLIGKETIETMKENKSEDNLLIEWSLAIDLHKRGIVCVVPLLVGQRDGSILEDFQPPINFDDFPDTLPFRNQQHNISLTTISQFEK